MDAKDYEGLDPDSRDMVLELEAFNKRTAKAVLASHGIDVETLAKEGKAVVFPYHSTLELMQIAAVEGFVRGTQAAVACAERIEFLYKLRHPDGTKPH